MVKFLVKDKENEMIIESRTSNDALNQFILYFYGGVIYQRNVTIELV